MTGLVNDAYRHCIEKGRLYESGMDWPVIVENSGLWIRGLGRRVGLKPDVLGVKMLLDRDAGLLALPVSAEGLKTPGKSEP